MSAGEGNAIHRARERLDHQFRSCTIWVVKPDLRDLLSVRGIDCSHSCNQLINPCLYVPAGCLAHSEFAPAREYVEIDAALVAIDGIGLPALAFLGEVVNADLGDGVLLIHS